MNNNNRLTIVHLNIWYSSGFGYTENMLPKALAKQGHEVHLITSNTQIYWYEPMYKQVYEERLGPGITSCSTFEENGVTIHRLPFFKFCPFKSSFHQFEQFGVSGVYQLIEKIKPDVIQSQGINLYTTFYAARYSKKYGIKLFTENHIHKSVFNPKNRKLKAFYNFFNPFLREINRQTSKCFPISKDAEDLTLSYYKVPKAKIVLQSLGVDTEVFSYLDRENRHEDVAKIRSEFGFSQSDIVVIYTGRFTSQKNPLCLAKAIDYLRNNGHPEFRGLFIGNGDENYQTAILNCEGCIISDFVSVWELPNYYYAADIGVWPSQESMSQLDALSTGLPLVLSNTIEVTERIEGNGFLYEEGDHLDLAKQLLKLKDKSKRLDFGKVGARKIEEHFSWNKIANDRIKFFNS